MSSNESLDYMIGKAPGFGSVSSATDFLLTEVTERHHSATETYWFNFVQPEQALVGEVYLWVHSNLRSCTAGVWIWQGEKRHHLLCEHFNVQHYLPYPSVDGQTLRVPQIGLTITVHEPLRKIEVEYQHAASGTQLRLMNDALLPPVMRANNAHFEQPMRVCGEVRLGGRSYAIDCCTMRDRSWGQPRMEDAQSIPPLCWGVPVSVDGALALNFSGCDDPQRGVEWQGAYSGVEKLTLLDGWIYRDQRLRRLRRMSKQTTRDPKHWMRPLRIDCELEDVDGGKHGLTGTLLAAVPWQPWSNMYTHWCHMRWQFDDGRIGYGDALEVFGPDYVRRFCG